MLLVALMPSHGVTSPTSAPLCPQIRPCPTIPPCLPHVCNPLSCPRYPLQVLREGRLSREAQRLQSYRSAFDRMYLGAMYRFLQLCRSAKPGVPPSRLLQRLQAELKAKPAAFVHGGAALHRARGQQQ